jgi:hypothetical protein
LAKEIGQRTSQASLVAMNQDRSLESENTEGADDRQEALSGASSAMYISGKFLIIHVRTSLAI